MAEEEFFSGEEAPAGDDVPDPGDEVPSSEGEPELPPAMPEPESPALDPRSRSPPTPGGVVPAVPGAVGADDPLELACRRTSSDRLQRPPSVLCRVEGGLLLYYPSTWEMVAVCEHHTSTELGGHVCQKRVALFAGAHGRDVFRKPLGFLFAWLRRGEPRVPPEIHERLTARDFARPERKRARLALHLSSGADALFDEELEGVRSDSDCSEPERLAR